MHKFFCIVFCFSSLSLLAKTTVYNGIAATVGKNVITVQDAYFFRALQRFKDGESPALLLETGDDLKHTVQKVVFEEMVYSEMKSFQFDGGSRTIAEKIVAQQKTKRDADWKAILAHFNVTESVAIDRLHKNLQVEKFLQKKIDTLTPVITDAEIEKYYKQNQSRFKGSDYEQIKPNISLLLKKQKMQKGLEEWVHFLKEKYGVTNLLDS